MQNVIDLESLKFSNGLYLEWQVFKCNPAVFDIIECLTEKTSLVFIDSKAEVNLNKAK